MSKSEIFKMRRENWLGVHSLDHIGLIVPDLEEARNFYHSFGLDVRYTSAGCDVRAVNQDHIWLKLKQGKQKKLEYISFGVFEDDLELFVERLHKHNIELSKREENELNKLCFFDPVGILVEIKPTTKVMPDSKAQYTVTSSPPGIRTAVMREDMPKVHPSRLAHALFFTNDIQKSVDFYCNILGLKVSDFPGPVAFLHGAHGSDHHLIAFAQSDVGPGYHHSAWDVSSLDEVGLGGAQMAQAGYKDGWGLGRHVLGSNYFNYIRDPWGSYAEYSYDIDYVPVELDWPAGYPAPENSLYLWGPDVPSEFIVNHEKGSSAD